MSTSLHTINDDGTQEWRDADGKWHRDNDLPAVIYANGDQQWFQHGEWHRDNDLPAYIGTNGDQHWYRDGALHRDNDLPAVICADGYQAWYTHGVKITPAKSIRT